MTDRKALPEQTETPEDVATLYSWANLHGAKYRDFSASRAQTREKARQRVQQAIEEERRRAWEEAEARKVAEATQQTIAAHVAVQGAVHATAGIRSAELTELVAPRAVQSFGQSFSSQQSFSQAPSVVLQNPPQAWRQPLPDRFATMPASSSTPDPLSNSIPIPSPGPISSFTPERGGGAGSDLGFCIAGSFCLSARDGSSGCRFGLCADAGLSGRSRFCATGCSGT